MKRIKNPDGTQELVPFENATGDWAKCEKITKEIMALSNEADKAAVQLAESMSKLRAKMVEAYESARFVDARFMDSPIAPGRLATYLRQYFTKLDCDWAKNPMIDVTTLKTLHESIKDSMRWLLKLKEYQSPKTEANKPTKQEVTING